MPTVIFSQALTGTFRGACPDTLRVAVPPMLAKINVNFNRCWI